MVHTVREDFSYKNQKLILTDVQGVEAVVFFLIFSRNYFYIGTKFDTGCFLSREIQIC